MAKFEFPRNPGTRRDNPFENAAGENPYSDGSNESDEAIAENVFATPADGSGERAFSPGDYEAILVPNSRRALRLAIVGIVPAGLGMIGAGVGIIAVGAWLTPLFVVLPLQFIGMGAAVPAFIIARRDLRAIKAGAMINEGKSKLRLAYWLAACGTLLGALPIGLYFGLLIYVAINA